ncbi:MAG: hypothetical protein ACPL4E_10335 [Thermoproteota archaeon]
MSRFEAEFERLRREVEEAVKRFLDLIEAHSSRVSEIERRVGLEEATPGLWEFLKEVRGLRSEARRELAEARESLVRELRVFRDRLREAASAEPGRRDELREAFDDLREFLEDRLEEAEDSLEEFLDRVEDVEDEIRDRIRELKRGVRRETVVLRVPGSEVKIPDVRKLVENALSRAWSGVPSTIVSSVRLPKADLDLIDALVEGNVFKSRNEGIAFFAHRGIEASRDFLDKAMKYLDEMRKLQEEARRELEGMLGEAEKPGGKSEGERREG